MGSAAPCMCSREFLIARRAAPRTERKTVPQSWRDLRRSPNGDLHLDQARMLFINLDRVNGSAHCAAVGAQLHFDPAVKKLIATWKRRGIVGNINVQEFSEAELEDLLLGTRRGKFKSPDFKSIDVKFRRGLPLYPKWLTYFRTCNGRPHYLATFIHAYQLWHSANGLAPAKPIQIRFEHAHIVRSARDLRWLNTRTASAKNTTVVWE